MGHFLRGAKLASTVWSQWCRLVLQDSVWGMNHSALHSVFQASQASSQQSNFEAVQSGKKKKKQKMVRADPSLLGEHRPQVLAGCWGWSICEAHGGGFFMKENFSYKKKNCFSQFKINSIYWESLQELCLIYYREQEKEYIVWCLKF